MHLKTLQGILGIWQQFIFSKLEIRFSDISVGSKTKDLVGYVKGNWIPLTSVGDQSSPKLNPTLFAGLPYARNRSLDWDVFCRGSSAKLHSTSHAHKMNSRPGIIIYAASQCILIVKNISISSIQLSQAVLIQPIQICISTDFVYTQLNVKTVLY